MAFAYSGQALAMLDCRDRGCSPES